MNPTSEQIKIIEAAKTGSSLAIQAYAGAAKTTTCRMIAEEVVRPSLYIAFNKAIADEAKTKFPSHVECRTLHSIAYETIVRGNKNLKDRLEPSLDTRQIFSLMEPKLEALVYKDKWKYVRELRDVVGIFCNSAQRDIYEIASKFKGRKVWSKLAVTIGVDCIDEDFVKEQAHIFGTRAKYLWECLTSKDSDMAISHDIYLKLYHLANPTIHNTFKVIYLDEAQDSNDLTLDIVKRCAAKGSQVIFVGDTYQSIYAWRGAVNAFGDIPENFIKLNLTSSFRFHSDIAKKANSLISFMGAEEELTGSGLVKESYDKTDMAILCRTNSGVFEEIMKFAEKGEKVYCTSDFTSFFSAMWHMIALYKGTQPKYKYKEFADITNWAEWEEELELGEIDLVKQCNYWLAHFKYDTNQLASAMMRVKDSVSKVKEPGMLTVTTLHKSKGLEWNVVKISDDVYRPLKDETYEEGIRRIREGYRENQEGNLLYVGVTRAMQKLVMSETVKDLIYGV